MTQGNRDTWTRDRLLSEQVRRVVRRRQEHIAALGLPIANCSMLEVGGGVGDHLDFFVDRNCSVLSTDAREECLQVVRQNLPTVRTRLLDLDKLPDSLGEDFDIVYFAGVIYQLTRPAEAVAFLARHTRRLMFLQSIVTPGDGIAVNLITDQDKAVPMTMSGYGCRPTRGWIFAELKKHFPFVYVPATQPYAEDYPTDWNGPFTTSNLCANFIGAREPLHETNPLLLQEIPMKQTRQ